MTGFDQISDKFPTNFRQISDKFPSKLTSSLKLSYPIIICYVLVLGMDTILENSYEGLNRSWVDNCIHTYINIFTNIYIHIHIHYIPYTYTTIHTSCEHSRQLWHGLIYFVIHCTTNMCFCRCIWIEQQEYEYE